MSRDIMASELRKARARILEQKQFIDECMRQYDNAQKRACDAEAENQLKDAEIARLREALERIAQKCDVWEVRARHALHDPPWWNLGDIAAAALKERTP